MIDVPVSAAMTGAAATVAPDTRTVEAADRLRRSEVAAVVVTDAAGSVVGIVTESDIVAVVAEGGTDPSVGSFMSTPVVTTSPSRPVGLAADRMRDAGVNRLPVVDDGRYVGLVVRDDLAPYLSRHRLDIDWSGDALSMEGSRDPARAE
ncbi:cyclic nucleotide-binding/CBS domain-containing protein [Haloplanus sp.]|uniref:CBS domain-containing protein n=1 Tax=Haloplanus sp. TaxID=1961696 RepID=UPI002605A324|nr:CBS domain-containing protein [Haloplanus sp.]